MSFTQNIVHPHKFTTINCLLFYLAYTQVYPVVHFHAHEHDGETEFQLSVHPPQILLDDHHHQQDHLKSDNHEHQETHVYDDWDYTVRINKIYARNITLDYISLFRWNIDSVNETYNAMIIFPKTSLYLEHADIFLRGPPIQT